MLLRAVTKIVARLPEQLAEELCGVLKLPSGTQLSGCGLVGPLTFLSSARAPPSSRCRSMSLRHFSACSGPQTSFALPSWWKATSV